MYLFLSGFIMAASLVAAGFFFRFWHRTQDRFFAIFACAWLLIAAERIALALLNTPEANRPGLYFIRLAAFLLILLAIVDKNFARRS